MIAGLWALILIAPAAAQIGTFKPPPDAPGAAVPYYRISPEQAKPDRFDANDEFRKKLLEKGDHYIVQTSSGNILLVVEKGYLAEADLSRLASELQEARTRIPGFVGRPSRVAGRFTVYVYDDGPLSESNVPGAKAGELGVMLRFVKEDEAPLFHELAHLLGGSGTSQSLNEGFADYVQAHFRPGKAHAFIPAKANPHQKAKAAVAKYPSPFLEAVGEPGSHRWSSREIRFDFYYASWSFADYLIGLKDMKAFLKVMDAGATDASYQNAYGKSRAELRKDWLAKINQGA